jgi:hypothetical protein
MSHYGLLVDFEAITLHADASARALHAEASASPSQTAYKINLTPASTCNKLLALENSIFSTVHE